MIKHSMVGIYKITNPKGKVYIGQSTNIDKRKSAYKNYRCEDQISIHRSLKKYGWENHIFEIIEECPLEELQEKEIYWKRYYLDKVNDKWEQVLFCKLDDGKGGHLSKEIKLKISKGNKGKKRDRAFCENVRKRKLGSKHSKETKLKMSKPKSTPSPLRGKSQSQEHVENRMSKVRGKKRDSNSYLGINSKKIKQYDLNNNYLKTWNSIKEAEEVYGKGIKEVLAKKTKTSSGFIWLYEEESLHSTYKIEKYKSLLKPVIQLSLEGDFIKEWDSITSIQKDLGFPNSNISSVCRGKQKTAYGYKWKYKECI